MTSSHDCLIVSDLFMHPLLQCVRFSINIITLSSTVIALLPQLNVFYNIRSDGMMKRGRRNAEDHEAFHLNVELLDPEMNSAQLLICSR